MKMKIRKKIPSYINFRNLRLLQLINFIEYVSQSLKTMKENKKFLSIHKDFAVPPRSLSYDAYGHTNWQAYYDMGLSHAEYLAALIQKNIKNRQITICEWGCGPGRVIRHLRKSLNYERVELLGTDYNKRTIKWCKSHLKDINFIANTLVPPLIFEDECLDCIYAISVFTHLSEKLHNDWIKELIRVTKKDGIIIFSTQGDNFKHLLNDKEKIRYDSGKLVVRGKIKEGKKYFNAFHPVDYINALLESNNMTIADHLINPKLLGFNQDIWIVKK